VDEALGALTPGVIESRTLDISAATDDWLTDCGQPGPEHVMTLELDRTSDIELAVCSTGSHAVGLYRSGSVTDVCVAQTGSCIGPVESGCGLLTFGNRQPGLYYVVIEANGAQQAGQVDLDFQIIGCDPDDDAEILPPGVTTNFSFTTTTSRAQYDAGCGGTPSGGEWVLAFQLSEQSNLQVDWDQTGDHVFAIYNEQGGGCDNSLVSCEDPLGQAAGSTIFPRLAAGAYFLVIDSFTPGQEGDLTIGLTPL
jgi:hypothetical protein